VQTSLKYKLFWIFFFGIWMAYLESAVVVYLREIYFPEGFAFPMKLMPLKMALVELGREVATIFMLLGISFLGSRKAWSRFAIFMISFGVWDIWYYIWLKVMLNWPPSLLTWDILFLIPIPWVGPVLAPVFVSISLIFAGSVILYFEQKFYRIHVKLIEWIGLVSAGVIVFVSFIIESPKILRLEVPTHYDWILLIIGELLGFGIFFIAWRRVLMEGKKTD